VARAVESARAFGSAPGPGYHRSRGDYPSWRYFLAYAAPPAWVGPLVSLFGALPRSSAAAFVRADCQRSCERIAEALIRWSRAAA
jgi:hypothetical protein